MRHLNISSLCFSVMLLAFLTATAAFGKPSQYPSQHTTLDREHSHKAVSPWSYTPGPATYKERQLEYLRLSAEKGNRDLLGAAAAAILKIPIEPVPESTIQFYERKITSREDCADFTAIRVVQALYLNDRAPFLTPEQAERLKKLLIGFKYWIDEPGPSKMISWTENHQILFHAAEYLAGQRYKDEIFTNNGQTGKWHMDHARQLLMKWIERRARWGFSEWDSNAYYAEDFAAIGALVEFAEDPEVATASAIVTDLVLFDMANDLYYGIYGTSHGRAYDQDILSYYEHSVVSMIKMVWGYGVYYDLAGMDVTPYAASTRYTPPQAIILAGQQNAMKFSSFERHGIPIEKAADYGLDTKSLDDLTTFLGMGFYSQPEVVDTFILAADKYNLWEHPFMKDIADLAKSLPRDGSLGRRTRNMEIETNRTMLGEVNKVSYHTPDYMLSTAQSYRPGTRANQHHIWQATLSPDAIVFTTNPGSLEINDDRTPTYWAGQNRLPRIGQYKNLAIILYSIDTRKALGERNVYEYTHAFFPKWAFDEVIEEKGWIFGRFHDGYIALYSGNPYQWNPRPGGVDHDIVANGKKAVWICLMGRKEDDGTFEAFRKNVLAAPLEINGLEVKFTAPGIGPAEFSWRNPLTVNGHRVPLNNYKLFDTPFGSSEFDSGILDVAVGDSKLHIDFNKRIREVKD